MLLENMEIVTKKARFIYDGFINAAKEAFDNKIPVVVDRFHVACLYRKALSSLRETELKRLKKSLSKEEYKTLHKAIQILRPAPAQSHYKKPTFHLFVCGWTVKKWAGTKIYLGSLRHCKY